MGAGANVGFRTAVTEADPDELAHILQGLSSEALAKVAIALDAGDDSTTPMQIFVNTLGGDTFELEVLGDMSIAALKIAVSQKVFHDSELDSFTSLSLVVGDRKLGGDDDELSLVAAGIQQGASVVAVKEQCDRDQVLAVLKQLTKDTNFTLDAKQLVLNGRADLTALPKEIGLLKKVRFLNLDNCEGLRALPKEISLLTDLRTLQLTRCCNLTALPKEIGQLKNLVALLLGDYLGGCTSLAALPREIGNLDKLQCLNLRYCISLKGNIETKQMIQQLKETRGDAIKIFHVQSVWPDLPDLDRES